VSLQRIADYTITRELGQGGMGKVYQALSPDGATVALKTAVWPEGLDARARWETVERFQREARAARSLQHPGICQVLDIGADQDTFFIVMEFLDGQSVGELIELAGAIKLERALEIMLSTCEALAYAHEKGIVHRDIKPDNVMVLRTGQVKLTDFGLASIVHETGVTQTGTSMGTFAYMSPEQARGEKVDERSDIFSLGATFYEMLTGRRAFDGQGIAAVTNQILQDDPTPVKGVPTHVSVALSKCLRKKREHRFANVRELIDCLRGKGAGREVTRTAVLPPRTAQPAAPSGQSPRTAPPATPGRPAASRTPSASGAVPDLRCPKCNEPMTRTTAACWKCGTPNPAIARRRERAQSNVELRDALQSLDRSRRSGWFRKRK